MAIDASHPPRSAGPEQSERPPRLAQGVELIGEYAGSGMSDPPYIARRPDGQVVQMKRLLYLVAEEIDGRKDYEAIADRATERYQLRLKPDVAAELVGRLRDLGIVASANGVDPTLRKVDPLLALKLRAGVVPPRLVQRLAAMLRPLFLPPVVACMVAALVGFDVWLFGYHGIAQSVRQTLYDPAFILLMLALVVASAAFHELGHASACSYGGARPGTIGFGVYIVWPAFYTDVTDAYRLGRAGRLRTDLGGVYFNAIFVLATAAAYFATGFEPLLLIIPLQHAEMIHQLLPFIRLDGYYVVSDLAGVPDMLARIKPTLASLLPWREPDPSVRVLKPWVRAAVSGYVLTLVPLVLLVLAMLVLNLPRMLATSWDSGRRELHTIATAAGAHDWPTLLVSCVQLLVLVLVPVGLGYTLAQLATKIVSGVRRATAGRPWARAGTLAVAAGAAAFAAYSLLPSNGYRPIASGEKGTLAQAFDRLRPAHDRPGATHPRGRTPAPVGRPRIGDGGAATPPARAPHRARPAAGGGRTHSASTTGRASPSAPPAPSESPPAGTSNPTASTPAATVSTPAATVSVPSVTVTAPDAGATPPAVTATTPAATVTTPAATVTAPSVTVTTPTLPTPTVTTPSLP